MQRSAAILADWDRTYLKSLGQPQPPLPVYRGDLGPPALALGHKLLSPAPQQDIGTYDRVVCSYFFRRSRISVRSFTSGVGPGGFGASCGWSLLIPLIAMNKTHATIKKFRVIVRNWPQPNTAPCFLASAYERPG